MAALAAFSTASSAEEEKCQSTKLEIYTRTLLQRKLTAGNEVATGESAMVTEAMSELVGVTKQLKGEVERLREGLQREHNEVVTLREMLSSTGQSAKPGPASAPKNVDKGAFELCKAGNVLNEVVAQANTSLHDAKTSCSAATEVTLFSPTASSPFFETECCPVGKEHCAGCAKQNSGKTACEICSGGFTKSSGKCVACVDLPAWVNKAGQNCHAASCSSEKFQGFSPNEACCKCGGGQKAPTKFAYYVGPMAVGATSVVGHPVPRTASHYSVDKDCELAKYGLSIHPTTGALQLDGCSAVGCGAATVEVKCTVTAEKDGLMAAAPIEVLAGDIGYGSGPVVLRGTTTSLAPILSPNSGSSTFSQFSCVPSASWLNLDSSTGRLSLKSGTAVDGGVTDSKGAKLGQGGVCTVQKGTAKGSVVVIAPDAWTSMSYSYSTSVLYATVGERSPILSPTGSSGLIPTRFSADCSGASFGFDVLSGIATWEGHQIFSLDIFTGDLQLNPEESLTKSLDSSSAASVRRAISTSCTIFGHYEWAPASPGPVVTHRLSMEFRDHTCWASRTLDFARRADKGAKSSSDCRTQCRSESYCSYYQSANGRCYFYSALCTDSGDFGCSYKNVPVIERYPGCGERHGCLQLELPGRHYISGRYCPGGENAGSAAQGPVFFKKGLTKEESFWLMRYDTSRGGCSSGDWVIYGPKPLEDYENSTMAYVELHGGAVACVRGSSNDLVSDVFTQTKVDLTVGILTVSGASATVSAPGCVSPNVTAVDSGGEQPVEALVLDDPSTTTADDHWLHPCECVPAKWGSLPPASGQSVSDIPAGSNNEFMPSPSLIVDGQFVCSQEHLVAVIVESETDGLDDANCKTRCVAQECPYYWEGEVMSTKQCRIYSQCDELVREVGVVGNLFGMSYRKSCKVADPQLCWKVTKRRSFLGAGADSYQCFHQDLVEQCDQKLMLGGLGVTACGGCEYAPVKGKQIFASNGNCVTADGNDNLKVAACNNGDNQKWYFDGETLKPEHKDGTWCVDKGSNSDAYLYPCHGGDNQKWYLVNGLLRNRDGGGCMDYFIGGSKNMYVGNCPWSNLLAWTWRQTVHGGQYIKSDYQYKCLIHNSVNHNVYISFCTPDYSHRWYWDGERLKSELSTSKCLDKSGSNNLYMHTCHSGPNQKWYFDGNLLKSRDDGRCVDFSPAVGNNAILANCPDSPYKLWSWGPEVPKPIPAAQLTVMSDHKCLDMDWQGDQDIYMHDCHSGNNQKWYFEGKSLKTVATDTLCADEPADGSLYAHTCHGNDNQQFYMVEHEIKNEKWGNAKCVDYGNDDIYMHNCHGNANQRFNFKVPMLLKDRMYGECLEMGSNKQSLTMTACVAGNDRQLFFFDGPQLKSQHDSSRCLEPIGNTLKMWACQNTFNGQKWRWDGERLKVESNGKCMDVPTSRAVYTNNCHSGDNQKFYFEAPVEIGRTIRSYGKCLQIGSNRLAYWSTCTDSANQRFYFDGEAIKSEYIDGCLDSWQNTVRLHNNCNGHPNQRWYWDGGHLKSKWQDDCLDVQPNNNTAFMGSCPDSDTVKFSFHNLLQNSVQLTVGNGRCLSRTDSGSTVEAVGCAAELQQMWYFSGENLKTEFDHKCMDLNGGSGNIHMSNCHSNNDQKFYFDGDHLRDRHFNRCLEYEVQSGNVFSGTCPDQSNFQWQFASQLALKKTPLPSSFVHGQSLEAKCWSERFTAGTLNAAHSRTMSCVAGAWINSWNSPGLDGFTCSACVQVVSKVYADLDSQIRQELFFASGMKLTLSVDTRTPRTVTASGSLQEGGTADVFVAEPMPNAAETTRRYRSLSEEGKCLKALSLQLSSADCAEEAEADEMLEAGELGVLLWDEFQSSADVPAASGAGLYNRGTAPTTLRSFNVDKDCSPHVMSSVQLSHNSLLGMSASCTAASTYGDAVQHTIAVPGAVQITSVSEGTCMSINEIIPWKLVISQDGRCMDYHTDGSNNVYIAACHGNANQQWYMLDGNILSMMDNKCLDAHTSTDNVYMHECHDGANQKWYFDEDTGAIRSEYDHRCLDKASTDNLYMHDCHGNGNQQFARQEMSSEAFITALHFDCIEDVGQQISVEPDGNNAMFRLRAGAHTLSEKFTYDSDTQKIKNIANNKCLQARGRGRVDEMDCTQRIEQDWTISHGLPGLVDAPITCPGDQVISHLKKTHGQVEYKCSHVSSLGMCSPHYSTQVETKTHELETIKALRELGAFCPPGEGLKTLETEASDKGAWIRFKYECCQISRVPVSIYPLMIADDKRDFDTDMAEAWEGVYCPSGSDDSGRLDFAQRRSFKPGQTASGSLTYDKNLGNWCVSGKGCAQSDVVHPLDTQLHTDDWYVVPVSDFDAIFEARGAKQVSTTKRKPPPLIQFGASDPEYLPECKDESIPGSRKFTLAKMNAEAQNLDDENPCKYVYGVPPTNSDMDNADGLTGWIDDLVENVGPGQGGVTYKSVKECADRDDIRALQMAKWSQSHNYHSIGFGFVKDLWDAYADGMPEVEAAPLGAGFEFQPGSVMAAYGALYFGMLQMSEDIRLQQNEMHFEEAGYGDCNPLQHGFARTFCDLHCIRDAVRKGDDAILRAVEEAVEIIGKNTQILLEHYVGSESGSLVQEGTEIRRGLAAQLSELRATAQEAALQPRASQAAERAVRSFSGRWRRVEGAANASESLASLRAMAEDASELHSTVMLVKGQRLSHVEEVQRNALETASRTNDFLKAKVHDLGLYHQTARRSKMVQRWFKQHWQNKFSMLDEFQELSVAQAMQTFDTSWWEIRRKLDAYLDAATEQARAMSSAVDALRGYTGKCQTSFEQLKNSYAASVRAEKKAHAVLKKTWSDVVFQAGLMASKITDAGLLDRLVLADIKASKQPTVDKAQLPAFCSSSDAGAFKLMHAHLAEVTGQGLLGQTQRQIGILFLEMAMLRHRFQTGGLGEAPNAEEAREAEERLGHALEDARSGANHLAADVVHHWRSHLCER